MKRRLITLATTVLVAMALTIPAGAADLHNPGTDCGAYERLHFVNNQTRGDSDVYLYVVLDDGTTQTTLGPEAPHFSNGGTNHWTFVAGLDAKLVTAFTSNSDGDIEEVAHDGVGRLVLSDYECKKA